MRLVRTLFLIFLAIILVVISLANSENVSLYLLPKDLSSLMGTTISINIPIFLVFFSGIFIGLIVGFVWEWLREHKFRVEANLNEKRLSRAETELSEMHAKDNKGDDVLTLLEKVEMKNQINAFQNSCQNLWYN